MILTRDLTTDVVTAARRRIINIFANGLPVYMSFSGGKDSLVLAHLTLSLGLQGKIDLSKLRVEFIDEEAIFPCVERIVTDWRQRFISVGSRFDWFCLEVRHYSCLNQLENDESFICWDRYKSNVWVRQPPGFSIRSHPLLRQRVDTYQEFLKRLNDGLHMTGVRVNESVQRLHNVARKVSTYSEGLIEPIYDWYDADVWHYLYEHDIIIPDAYMYLYQIGVPNARLRISQFFSIDTAFTLSRITEFYPNLMDAILRREPNAYIVSLYWDSEMFRRRTRPRVELEEEDATQTYKEKVLTLLSDIPANFKTAQMRDMAERMKRNLLRYSAMMTEQLYRQAYDILKAGDPKLRSTRALISHIAESYAGKHARSGFTKRPINAPLGRESETDMQ